MTPNRQYNADGKKELTCDLDGPDHGCSGADWQFQLDYPYNTELSDLRDFAMRFFSAGVSGRSALLSGGQCPGQQNVDQCSLSLWRSGACLERRWIAEYAGNATNDRLKTANEAAAMDEAEMATPDALD